RCLLNSSYTPSASFNPSGPRARNDSIDSFRGDSLFVTGIGLPANACTPPDINTTDRINTYLNIVSSSIHHDSGPKNPLPPILWPLPANRCNGSVTSAEAPISLRLQ